MSHSMFFRLCCLCPCWICPISSVTLSSAEPPPEAAAPVVFAGEAPPPKSALSLLRAAPATHHSETSPQNAEKFREKTLWYRRPAARWLEALPVGNGRLGAMVWGGIRRERISLNESTFWSGAPSDRHENPEALNHLGEIRRLFFEGKYREAVGLTARHLLGRTDTYGTHLPLGDLQLEMLHEGGEVRDYRRELDMDEAIARVEYSVGGARFRREVLASHVDGVLAVRLAADAPGKVSLRATFQGGSHPWKVSSPAPDTLSFSCDARETKHSDGKTGVTCLGIVRALPEGGKVSVREGVLDVAGADALTLLVVVNTSYVARDFPDRSARQIADAAQRSYAEIRDAHVADHRRLFQRVAIELCPAPADGQAARRSAADGHAAEATPTEGLPTDERLARLRAGRDDPGLAALFFQYGRYLLIAGSREDSPLPTHLQGIWNDNLACNMGWTCDFHLDINTQQNYWPAEVCNLGECHEPLFRLIESLRDPGRRTARVVYGAKGWVCHVFTNAWGYTAPGWGLGWGMHPVGGVWIALHLWQHYEFTGDREFLARRAYPVLKEAAEFFLDYMVEHPKHGYLVTGPSTSPENAFVAPDGSVASESMGPTHDRVMVHDLFTCCSEGSKILEVDEALRGKLEEARAKLPPLKVGKHGQLMEWLEDFDEAAPNHRHTSHLAALYPSSQITRRGTRELAGAARVTIERRMGRPDWEDVEWSRANAINYFARLGDGERAHESLLGLIRKLSDTNLLTFSAAGIAGAQDNIFCVDGNSAGTAGIAEMLLQSHVSLADPGWGREIEFLPAVPKAWPAGSVRGLRARGGFEVDMAWKEGKLTEARIRSLLGSRCRLRYGDVTKDVAIAKGETLRWTGRRE